jgi:hypothetical protein
MKTQSKLPIRYFPALRQSPLLPAHLLTQRKFHFISVKERLFTFYNGSQLQQSLKPPMALKIPIPVHV